MTHKQGSNAEADASLRFVIQTTTLQGMSMALRAYSTLLVGMETLVVQWLHRRREAVSDVQRLSACRYPATSVRSGTFSGSGCMGPANVCLRTRSALLAALLRGRPPSRQRTRQSRPVERLPYLPTQRSAVCKCRFTIRPLSGLLAIGRPEVDSAEPRWSVRATHDIQTCDCGTTAAVRALRYWGRTPKT